MKTCDCCGSKIENVFGLEPCPFCGSKKFDVVIHAKAVMEEYDGSMQFCANAHVVCGNCGMQGPVKYWDSAKTLKGTDTILNTIERAVAAWKIICNRLGDKK